MRRFHSYGPVDCQEHFCVERKELVEKCIAQLTGNPDKGGHYFTIWAPRQTGKTWLMRQVEAEIPLRYPDQFTVFTFSLGDLRGVADIAPDYSEKFTMPRPLTETLQDQLPGNPHVENWAEFSRLFFKEDSCLSPISHFF